MLTDQTELAMMYESRTVKNTIGETHIWRNYGKPDWCYGEVKVKRMKRMI